MGKVKFDKGNREWQMFQDYWQLIQNFYEVEDTDVYWEAYIGEADKFVKKYDNEMFPRDLVLALTNKLEKEIIKK